MEKILARAIGEALLRTADSWIYNCDGGCFETVCSREAWDVGDLIVIYQPHKSMREYDDMFATIFIKRKDKKAFKMKDLNSDSVLLVKKLMMESFLDILKKSNNLWTHPIKNDFQHLVQIKDDFRIEKGAVRFTFEIRGAYDGCCGDRWEPHRLRAYIEAKNNGNTENEAIAAAEKAGKDFETNQLEDDFKNKLKCEIK